MGKKLVIIEAPGKLDKFRKSLGSGFDVLASVGHIADLPEKGLNVNIKKKFEPTYAVYPDKKDVVKQIVDKAKKADIVYLMMDEDREGTAIAWHISQQLPKGVEFKRATTGSITKSAIMKGIEEARGIDMDMVASYEARRILDRLVGYKCSYVTKQATGGSSAGRTQSAGLRILAEREKAIQGFNPVEYWPIQAELLTEKFDKIIADIKKPKPLDISTKEEATKIIDRLKKGPVLVSKYDKKEVKQQSYAPFTTSTLYQSAVMFGWKTDKTASIAQKLYEAGAITYHRTDSTFIVPEFLTSIKNHVVSAYGKEYSPSKPNSWTKKKGAQEAHEACRVTDLEVTEFSSGDNDQRRLYEVIWKRTVASQMSDTKTLRINAEFSCDGYVLGASGARIIFDGWRKVWDYGGIEEAELPEIVVGEEVKVIDIKTEKKKTQPPPRYNDRSFIKALEDAGIGRPSTYASIPKTLQARKYIENKKSITTTDLGLKVNDFLVSVNFCFSDISFTSKMEEKLDEIANKSTTKLEVLQEFWERLRGDIDNAKKITKDSSTTEHDCPKCKESKREAKLVLKHSRYGSFLSCQNYNDKENKCDYKADVGKNGEPVEKVVKEKVYSDIPCPKCESRLVVRQSRKGDMLGCEKFPSCQGLYDTDGNEIVFKKSKFKSKKKSKKKGKS